MLKAPPVSQAGLFVVSDARVKLSPFARTRAGIDRCMRAITALLLSLVLAIGSMSMAVARGQAPMGAAIALCSADGVIPVVLDAQGNPQQATPRHLCPDCLSAATAFALCTAFGLPVFEQSARCLSASMAARLPTGLDRIPGHARDPPLAAG